MTIFKRRPTFPNYPKCLVSHVSFQRHLEAFLGGTECHPTARKTRLGFRGVSLTSGSPDVNAATEAGAKGGGAKGAQATGLDIGKLWLHLGSYGQTRLC